MIILIVVALIIPITQYYLQRGSAREALREAKIVYQATQAIAYEYRGDETSISDSSKVQGIKQGVKERILELASTEGTIQELVFDDVAFQVKKLIFIHKSHCVTYEYDGEEPNWTVYRLEKILEF